jgi:hypothetical protein
VAVGAYRGEEVHTRAYGGPGGSLHRGVAVRIDILRCLQALDARGLRPIRDRVVGFEAFWTGSFDRLGAYVRDRPDLDEDPDDPATAPPTRRSPSTRRTGEDTP